VHMSVCVCMGGRTKEREKMFEREREYVCNGVGMKV